MNLVVRYANHVLTTITMPRTRKKQTDARSPLVRMRDSYFATHPELTDPVTLGVPRKNRGSLENRLVTAFLAGATAADVLHDEQPDQRRVHGQFTESTLLAPGWYFFYPEHPTVIASVIMPRNPGGMPRFVDVTQEAIDGGHLRCRTYEGTYLGPIVPPLPRAAAPAVSDAVKHAVHMMS